MIYFTKLVDYAVIAMVCIAKHPHESLDVKRISAESGVPEVFLAKILQKLRRAGLVVSKRGVSGGFLLSRGASSISVLDIVTAVGGLNVPNSKVSGCSQLVSEHVLSGMNRKITEHLASLSIAGLTWLGTRS